jgi:peptidoglycan/xylan/chitin deacetylase (PgdA/CDA1 family)
VTFVAERASVSRRGIPRSLLLILVAACLPPAFSSNPPQPAEPGVQVPILVYHRFGPVAANDMTVTMSAFRSQMEQLVEGGYTVISLQRLVGYFMGNAVAPPSCSVVITADDGHRSIYTDMAPVAKEYGIPVTLFVYPSAISNAAWAMTWEQLKELKATGLFDTQSHTFWHPNFQREHQRLESAEYERFVAWQLRQSKTALEQKLLTRVDLLAWPFGIYNDWLMNQAQQAGYVAGFSLKRRPASNHEQLMALPRYLVTDSERGLSFERVLGCRSRR